MTAPTLVNIDLQAFHSGDPQARLEMIERLGHAYSHLGFATITGHHLDQSLVTELYQQVESFFALPEKNKRKYHEPGIAGQRGYVPFKKEQAVGANAPDLKEFWHHGPNYSLEHIAVRGETALKNVMCKEMPEFSRTLARAHRALQRTGQEVLSLLAVYLGLEPHYFDSRVRDGDSLLRAIHYPPILEADTGASIRAAAHEDINLITLLMGASAEGLEVQTPQGDWLAVSPPADALVVNVGDMLQRLSNGRLRSTTHRVINPEGANRQQPRFSIPFFLHPRSDVSLACLENCIDAQHPKQYDDISAGAYLAERLEKIRLATH